jgi:hypothetical protein
MGSARVNDKVEQEQGMSQIDAFYFEVGVAETEDGARDPASYGGPDYKDSKEAHGNADDRLKPKRPNKDRFKHMIA